MTLTVKAAATPLHGNRELISQALANLVENAIKYGKPSAAAQPLGIKAAREIVIEARREGDSVLLSVTDHAFLAKQRLLMSPDLYSRDQQNCRESR